MTKDEKLLVTIAKRMEDLGNSQAILIGKTDGNHIMVGCKIDDDNEFIKYLTDLLCQERNEARELRCILSMSILGAMMANDEFFVKFDESY